MLNPLQSKVALIDIWAIQGKNFSTNIQQGVISSNRSHSFINSAQLLWWHYSEQKLGCNGWVVHPVYTIIKVQNRNKCSFPLTRWELWGLLNLFHWFFLITYFVSVLRCTLFMSVFNIFGVFSVFSCFVLPFLFQRGLVDIGIMFLWFWDHHLGNLRVV